jgi:hypothetical protein
MPGAHRDAARDQAEAFADLESGRSVLWVMHGQKLSIKSGQVPDCVP